jgi:hypothetical protein
MLNAPVTSATRRPTGASPRAMFALNVLATTMMTLVAPALGVEDAALELEGHVGVAQRAAASGGCKPAAEIPIPNSIGTPTI